MPSPGELAAGRCGSDCRGHATVSVLLVLDIEQAAVVRLRHGDQHVVAAKVLVVFSADEIGGPLTDPRSGGPRAGRTLACCRLTALAVAGRPVLTPPVSE